MAMITCKKCGGEVSDKASFCPECGYPLAAEKAAMRQQDRWMLLLLTALLISIAGYLPVGESRRKQKPLLYVIVDSLKKSGKGKKKK